MLYEVITKPEFVSVPTGVARFPKEVVRFPRAWVERQYNVTHWTDMPRGGHFAAMEPPQALAQFEDMFKHLPRVSRFESVDNIV